MLDHRGHKVGKLACLGGKNLALAVNDIFLKVVRDCFAGTEILHSSGYGYAHLLAKAEEIVDGSVCRENNSGEVRYIDFLLAKFLSAQTFYLDKGTEHYLYAVFLSKLEIGRFVGRRLGL